jgi:thioesterase-3
MHAIAEITIRGYHLDFYGHVNNARYLEFLEEGRWTFFDQYCSLGYFSELDLEFNVVNININYRSPAKLGQILQVDTFVQKIGNKSVVFGQLIRESHENRIVADALVTFVLVDRQSGKAIPLEGELRELWQRLVGNPEG